MKVRSALPRDIKDIAEIWNAYIRGTAATFTTQEKTHKTLAELIETQPFFVSASDEQVFGFGTFGPFRSGPGYSDAAEHSIYVADHALGAGHGAALMRHLEIQARAAGIASLIAGLSGSNAAALRFHAGQGFQEVGCLPGVGQKFGTRHDLVFMMKKL